MGESTDKGGRAELAIAWAAARLDVVVLRPLMEGRRYDLIFDLGPRLLRVQCKWASRRGDVVSASLRTSRHSPTRGYVVATYSADEVDAIALYCDELERCYLVPICEVAGHTHVQLRLAPARNNQQLGVRMASDYDLAKMVHVLGAIAQLGERRHGMAEVVGSSPTSSTP